MSKAIDWQRKSQSNPLLWMERCLRGKLWSKQRDIVKSVRDNQRTIVQSCFGSGKSHIAGKIILWFQYNFIPSKVITTATSWNQVEKILWSEIGAIYNRAKVPLGGRLLQTELKLQEDWFSIGLSPQINVEQEATRFEGYHSPNVLVVIDQAQGINPKLWDVAISLVTNESSRILVLGNPASPSGRYYDACRNAELWNKIHIPASCVPNVIEGRDVIPGLITREWIEDRKADWGKDNPLYISKVLAEFPEETEDTLILLSWIESARDRELNAEGSKGLGVDVARFGDAETVLTAIHGAKVLEQRAYKGKDTMKTCGNIIQMMDKWGIPAHSVCVDDTGVGGGVTDRLHEEGHKVQPINNGSPADRPEQFFNMSAEIYWTMRERFKTDNIDIPNDPILMAQLAGRKYDYTSKSQIKLEGKDDMVKRGLKSPDRADSLALAIKGQSYYSKGEGGPRLTVIE